MGITLTSKTINSTYDSLLKLSDNDQLTGAFKVITDGLGNDTGISINNTGSVNISGTLVVNTKIQTPLLQLTGGTGTQGQLSWNADEETLDLVNNGAVLQLGQEMHIHVRNNSATTAIPDGTPVYVAGTLGASGRLKVAPMIADGSIDAKYFIGVTTEVIEADGDGKVTWFGKVRGFDTSAYAEGTTLYVSETVAGGWQTTPPTAPNPTLEAAITVNAKSNGTIFVRADGGHYLNTLHDVHAHTPLNGQPLVYDSTDGHWHNASSIIADVTGNLIGDVTGNVTGQVSDISNHNTDALDEGLTNLYYLDSRVDSHLSGGTGVTYSSGVISIGQSVGIGDNVKFNNLELTGNITFNGTATQIDSTIWTAGDNLVQFANENIANTLDLGYYANYSLDAGVTTKYTGLFRDSTDNVYKFFEGLEVEPNTTVDTSHLTYSLADVQANTFIGALQGNADTATKWATARTITLGGDLSGNVSIDGLGDVTLTAAVVNDSHTHNTQYVQLASRGTIGGTDVAFGSTTGWGNNPTAGFYKTDYVGHSGNVFMTGDVGGSAASVALETSYSGYMKLHTNVDSTIWSTFDIWTSKTFTSTNISNWNTAYTYSQVGHLPLSGGTITGTVTANTSFASDLISSKTYSGNSFLNFNDDQTLNPNMTTLSSVSGLNLIWDSNNNDSSTFAIWDASGDVDTATKRFEIDGNGDANFLGNVTVDGELSVVGTIDLSNADLNIGAADIIFDTTSAQANRGLVWDVDGGFLSKFVGGGTNGGMVELYTNMDDIITTGDVFRVKEGSIASTLFSIAGDGAATFSNSITASGGNSSQWNTAYTYSQVGHLPLSGGTLTGNITRGELEIGLHPVHTGYYGIWNTEAFTSSSSNYMIINKGSDTYITGNDKVYIRPGDNSSTNQLVVTTSGTTIGGNTVWHAGNDGSGSGLDADKLDGQEGSYYAAAAYYLPLVGGTLTGTLTIDTSDGKAFTLKGTSPTISLLDDDGGDDFYIHVNSNNFYVLANRDANDLVGTGWEGPHPLQLEADTNIGYLFGNRIFNDGYHPNADKWTTARTITLSGDLNGSVSIDGSSNVTLSAQVVNDSHTHDGRYYTEAEIQTFFNRGYINSHSASNLPVGWYTIATNTGNRALGEFQIWDTASSDHQSVLFNASHHYGTDSSNDITVLANSRYSGTNFRYIRIKDGGTYDGAALQVYVDGSSNSVNVAIVGGNAQSSGWVIKDWVPDATDPGDLSNYTTFGVRCQVDLDQVINGGIITTGEIYSGGGTSQFRVLNTGDEGSGNGLDADTVDSLQASQFLRSDTSDTMSGNLTFSGDSRYINLSGGTTNSQNALIIGEQNVYGVRFRWDSGSALQFDGYWNSSTTGTENRDLGYIDVNNRIWYLNQRVQANESLRAPIFYDTNDTNYYLNANGDSRINRIFYTKIESPSSTNNGRFQNHSSWGTLHQTDHGYIQLGPANTGWAHIYTDRPAFYTNKSIYVLGGSEINAGDVRSAIFYDKNNTGYYVNPASQSHFNTLTLAGNRIGFVNTSFDAEIRVSDENLLGTGASFRFYGDTGQHNAAVYSEVFYATNSMYANTFYDANNTGYYVNPASTTQLNVLDCNGNVSISSQELRLVSLSDGNHYLKKISTGYSGFTIDGPQLQGHQGGELTTNYTGDNWALRWAIDGNVFVNNTLSAGGDVIAYSSSDPELKDNMTPISNPLDKVMKIGGYEFDWNDKQDTYEAGTHDIGVNAEEIEEILPDIVTERKNGYKAVKYEKIVPLLIEAVKEQQSIIDKQQQQIEELKQLILKK